MAEVRAYEAIRQKDRDVRKAYYTRIKSDSAGNEEMQKIILERGLNDPDETIVDKIIHLYFNDRRYMFTVMSKEALLILVKVYSRKDVTIKNEILSKIAQLLPIIMCDKELADVFFLSFLISLLSGQDLKKVKGVKVLLEQVAGFAAFDDHLETVLTACVLPNKLYKLLKVYADSPVLSKSCLTRVVYQSFASLEGDLRQGLSSYHILMVFLELLKRLDAGLDAEQQGRRGAIADYLLGVTSAYYSTSAQDNSKIMRPLLLTLVHLRPGTLELVEYAAGHLTNPFIKPKSLEKLVRLVWGTWGDRLSQAARQKMFGDIANYMLCVRPTTALSSETQLDRVKVLSELLDGLLDTPQSFEKCELVDPVALVLGIPALDSSEYLKYILKTGSVAPKRHMAILKMYMLSYQVKGRDFGSTVFQMQLLRHRHDADNALPLLLTASQSFLEIHSTVFRFVLYHRNVHDYARYLSSEYTASAEYKAFDSHLFPRPVALGEIFQELPLIIVLNVVGVIFEDPTVSLIEKYRYARVSWKLFRKLQCLMEGARVHWKHKERSKSEYSVIYNKQQNFFSEKCWQDQAFDTLVLTGDPSPITYSTVRTLQIENPKAVSLADHFPSLTSLDITISNLHSLVWKIDPKKMPLLKSIRLSLRLLTSYHAESSLYEYCTDLVLLTCLSPPSAPLPSLKSLTIRSHWTVDPYQSIDRHLPALGELISTSRSLERVGLDDITQKNITAFLPLLKESKTIRTLAISNVNFNTNNLSPVALEAYLSGIFDLLSATPVDTFIAHRNNTHPLISPKVDLGPFKQASSILYFRPKK